jgi:hypothetical protein
MGHLRNFRPAAWLPALLVTGSVLSLHGQVLKSTILGTITDSSGSVVPNAQVMVTETGTNVSRTIATNDSGLYTFANLDPGIYRVDVEHAGFRKISRSSIDVPPNNTVRIDLELVPGAITEIVDVTGEAAILKTDRADTGGQLEVLQLQAIPLASNRNYQGLLMTIPGTGGRAMREHSEFYNSQDNLSNRVNGQERAATSFMIEGVDNNIETGNLTAIIPPIEAIQTVDVNTSNYDSEFGRAGAGVVNATIKSGTNNFHGSLFEFHKNDHLYAKDVFATTKALTVYNQFGGTLGGKIRRDKTFFFVDYQGSRDRKGSVEIPTIPTMPFRAGDFSSSPTTIYDPLTGTADGRNRTPFQNQQIPTSRISPIAQKLLSFLPPPTRSGFTTNFEKTVVRLKQLDAGDIKIDHVLTDNDRIMVRYSIQQANVTDPGLYGPNGGIYGGPHANGFQGYGPARTQSLGLNYSKVFSPTLVMELRGGVLRNRNDALSIDYGLTTSKDIGIPGVNLDLWSSGLTHITVDNYSNPMLGFEQSLPWYRATTSFSLTNNWTKTLRNHLVKWGYDLRRYRIDLQQTAPPRGRFYFGPGPTSLNGNINVGFANNFASFLLDAPRLIERGLAPVFPARRDWVHSLYVQDKWQVASRFTADLGVRWEYWPSSKPRLPGGFAAYNWTNNTIELAGIGDIPMDLGVKNHLTSFAPRLGLSYRVNPKTVFRAGYGISFSTRFISNYSFPVRQQNTYSPPNTFSAAGSLAAGIPAPDFFVIPANGIISPAPPTADATVTKKDIPHSYVESWNIALQRALPANFVMELAFVGNHVVNRQIDWDFNIGSIGGGRASQPFFARYGRSNRVNINIGVHQYYDALQAKFDRRFSKGLMVTTAYTYSKSLGYPDTPRQFFNLALERGRTDFDLTHVFTQTYLYDLPFGRGKRFAQSGPLRWVLGDWQVNGLLLLQTGRPLEITYPNTSLNAPGNNNSPLLVGAGKPEVFGNVGPGRLWFDTSRFAAPPTVNGVGTFGNVGRNILTGPGVVNLDLSVFRKFKLTERFNMEFRAESFNFSNTPHFARPGGTFGSANFGQVTASEDFISSATDTDNRKIQFGLRLFF